MAEEKKTIYIGVVGEEPAKQSGFDLIWSLGRLPNVERLKSPGKHSLKLKFCTVDIVFTDLKKLEKETVASTITQTTQKFDGGITFWKIEDHKETIPARNSNDDIGALQKVGIFRNDYIVQISSDNDNTLKSLIIKIDTLIGNTSGFRSSSRYEPYTNAFKSITKHFQDKDFTALSTTSSSSGKAVPFYRRNLLVFLGILFSAPISIGLFIGFALTGLLATPFISIPIIFAVLTILFVVKLAMNSGPPAVQQTSIVDEFDNPRHGYPSSSQPEVQQQTTKQPGTLWQQQQRGTKLLGKKEQDIEKFNQFLRSKNFDPNCFVVGVYTKNEVRRFKCSALEPLEPNNDPTKPLYNKNIEQLKQLKKLDESFIYNAQLQRVEITVDDFETLYQSAGLSPKT